MCVAWIPTSQECLKEEMKNLIVKFQDSSWNILIYLTEKRTYLENHDS